MALIPERDDEKAENARRNMVGWITAVHSPYHCVACADYVGFRHSLHDRTSECRLGSEC